MESYKYEVGQIINGVEILEKTRTKDGKIAYKYRCLRCGYTCGEYYRRGKYFQEYAILERHLDIGNGCMICSRNGAVSPDINSIKVSTPWMVSYLVNEDDSIKYSPLIMENDQTMSFVKQMDKDLQYFRIVALIL